MDLNLRNKTVLITGGSKGIGLACAKEFAAEGCNLHLVSRTKQDLENAKKEILPFDLERDRVIAHGVLHLLGFNDNTEKEQNEMRLKEDQFLKELYHGS